MKTLYSRRSVLVGLGAASLATIAPLDHGFAQIDDQPFYFFSDDEARLMAVLCDTLIPQDEFPSASQAGVVDFIDLQLSGPYGRGEGLYMQPPFPAGTAEQGWQYAGVPAEFIRRGLARLVEAEDASLRGDSAALEDLMMRMSGGDVDLGDISADSFFDEVWKLTNQGYFADPMYGGNADYAGWKMVGFPGAHAYYLSFVDKHNVPYPQPPMGINHKPGGNGAMPSPRRIQGG